MTGASDGPIPGVLTYARKTWTVAPSAIGNTGDTGFGNTTGNFVVVPGDVYTISSYLRASVSRNFNIGVYQYTPTAVAFSPSRIYAPTVFGLAGQWTRVNYTYTVPAGVGMISLVTDSNSSTANGAANWAVGSTLDGTALMVTTGSTLYNYGDGYSTNWIWKGGPNASSSTGSPI